MTDTEMKGGHAMIPTGYVKTGQTSSGHIVCCLDRYFEEFTGGTDTDHLGFVLITGELIPLIEYHRTTSQPQELSHKGKNND